MPKNAYRLWLALIGTNLVYACTSIFTKLASARQMLSLPYLLCIAGAVAVLGVYAVLWQQIIKRMRVSDAYMFKGTSIIFILLLSHFIFGEAITVTNMIGAVLIIGGIALNAKS